MRKQLWAAMLVMNVGGIGLAATTDRFECTLQIVDSKTSRSSTQKFEFDVLRRRLMGLPVGNSLYGGASYMRSDLTVDGGIIRGVFRLDYKIAERRDLNGRLVGARMQYCPSFSTVFCNEESCRDMTIACDIPLDPFTPSSGWSTPQIAEDRMTLFDPSLLTKHKDTAFDPNQEIVGTGSVSCKWHGTISDDNGSPK